MPSNVATPIWACDLCASRFGERRDLADQCETAPLPELLPPGTPMLAASGGRFALLPLTPNGRIETTVSRYAGSRPGHHREYVYGERGWKVTDAELRPALPGYVQGNDHHATVFHIDDADVQPGLDLGEMYRAVGLGQPGSPVADGGGLPRFAWDASTSWVKPITAEVRAVYDLLRVRLARRWRSTSQEEQERRNYCLHVAGGDGPKAEALLATLDPAGIHAAVRTLQERWFAGEDVSAPLPDLDASSGLTLSKMTKANAALVAATGFAWPPRTHALAYAHQLTREVLGMNTTTTARGFGTAPIVAVGGVKGGVGKTTTAVALSYALAAAGHRVVLIDLDLDGPNVHQALGLDAKVAVSGDLTRIVPEQVTTNLRAFSHAQISGARLPERWSTAQTQDWVRFLGQTLDVDDADVVVLDLPAGHGAVADQVLPRRSQAEADVLVLVTTSDPFALANTRTGLDKHMHERRQQILVENLGRIEGRTADGRLVEVRPHGTEQDVRNLISGTVSATYGGSLPYATSPQSLAGSQEVGVLARLVAQAARLSRSAEVSPVA